MQRWQITVIYDEKKGMGKMNGKRIAAVCCCAVAVLCILVMPVVKSAVMSTVSMLTTLGMPLPSCGADCFSQGEWIILLPILFEIAMAICAVTLDGKIGAAVCLVGMFVPIVTYLILINHLGIVGSVLQPMMGEGFIFAMVLNLAAAVLCFLDAYQPRKRTITAGLSSGDEDEW